MGSLEEDKKDLEETMQKLQQVIAQKEQETNNMRVQLIKFSGALAYINDNLQEVEK